MSEHTIFTWLADESNNRAILTLGTIFQIIGLIIPAFIAIVVYIRNAKTKARDDVIKFLGDWNSPERSLQRSKALPIFTSLNSKLTTFEGIMQDHEKRAIIASFLNECEYLALFIEVGGKSSFRAKIAKKFFRGIIIDYWRLSREFVQQLRDHLRNDRVFIKFQNIASSWESERTGSGT